MAVTLAEVFRILEEQRDTLPDDKRKPKRRSSYRRRRAAGESDPLYRAFIAKQPCVVCGQSPVEVAHVGDRAYSQKCPDQFTLPLCVEHHRTGQQAQHRIGRRFWQFYGLDKTALLNAFQSKYKARHSGR